MGTTLICNKCKEAIRVSSEDELREHQEEHKIVCDGVFVSVWLNYDKMTKEEKENITKQIKFKHGKLGKLQGVSND